MSQSVQSMTRTAPGDRLVSVYISMRRVSATVHVARDDRFLCMDPKIPLGKVEDRPEMKKPTCGRCADILAGKPVE